jgi:hypothetical protein
MDEEDLRVMMDKRKMQLRKERFSKERALKVNPKFLIAMKSNPVLYSIAYDPRNDKTFTLTSLD